MENNILTYYYISSFFVWCKTQRGWIYYDMDEANKYLHLDSKFL